MTQIVEVPEGAHSEVGPSSAERWLNCPGSVLASRGKPDVPSKYAIEGTAAHTVSEWARVRGVPASTFKGIKVRVLHGDTHTDVYCGKAMVESVQTFVDQVAEQPGEELVEARIQYEVFVQGGFGTGDSAKMSPGVCYVTDFKHGTGVKKDAFMNPQLLLYALGIWIDWNWLFDFQRFLLAISQPRLKHYDTWEISVEQLLDWAHEAALPGGVAALTPGAPFKAGSWCQFCRVKPDCLVYAEYRRERETGSLPDRQSDFENLDA